MWLKLQGLKFVTGPQCFLSLGTCQYIFKNPRGVSSQGPSQPHGWPSAFQNSLFHPSLPSGDFFPQICCLVNMSSICNVLTPFRCQECVTCCLGEISCPLDLLYKLGQTLTWIGEANVRGKFIILSIFFTNIPWRPNVVSTCVWLLSWECRVIWRQSFLHTFFELQRVKETAIMKAAPSWIKNLMNLKGWKE